MKFGFILINLTLLATIARPQEPAWLQKMREVKLLTHTYTDVLKILGPPSDGSTEPSLIEEFETKDGKFSAIFYSGKCVVTDYSDGRPIGWKVPKFTVIDLMFEPKGKIKPRQLGLDLRSFRKFESSDVPGAYSYENDISGEYFFVKRNGYIETFSLAPAEEFDYLACDRE